MVRCQNKGAQRLAEGQIEEELGHHAKGALLEGSHAACVTDIAFDFSTKPRLSNERGNAILVAKSIYEACRYFTLFNSKEAGFKCS